MWGWIMLMEQSKSINKWFITTNEDTLQLSGGALDGISHTNADSSLADVNLV